MRNTLDYYQVLGVNISNITVCELHDFIVRSIKEKNKALIMNVNAHCLNLAYTQPWLRRFLNSADIVFCDGAGVIFGANILGFPVAERITYADWIWQLAELAETHQYSLYLLGAKPGIAMKAGERLNECHPKLRIVGAHHGYFNKGIGNAENEEVIREINASNPDILIMGFGMPLQEQWLMENWDRLEANIALTGGAVFDYVSDNLRRAPRWMTNHGLEWLGRLIIEPSRLWRRYIIGNPIFLWRILLQRFGLLRIYSL